MKTRKMTQEEIDSWNKLYEKDLPIIGDFLAYVSKTRKSKYRLYFEDGSIVLATLFSMADSDNDLEMDDPFYEEFFEFYFKIEKIIKIGSKFNFGENENIALNYHNFFYKFEPFDEECD